MAITQSDKAKKFRALHAGPRAFVIPNPWDNGTARILAALGFEALATTSAGFAFTLGRRDEGLIPRTDVLAHCQSIVEASDLPVSADLENCFGDAPATVAETIRLAAEHGLVGASVEDSSNDKERPIYDFDQAVARVKAAVAAARAISFPFTLTARAENFLHGRPDLDDTIRRLRAFAEAGADVLYAPGLRTVEHVKAVCDAVAPKPVNVLAGPAGGGLPVASLEAAGARRISVGSGLAAAALGAFLRAAREIKDKGSFTYGKEAASHAEISKFMAGK